MGRGESGSETFLHLSVVGYEGYIASWVGRVSLIELWLVMKSLLSAQEVQGHHK